MRVRIPTDHIPDIEGHTLEAPLDPSTTFGRTIELKAEDQAWSITMSNNGDLTIRSARIGSKMTIFPTHADQIGLTQLGGQ